MRRSMQGLCWRALRAALVLATTAPDVGHALDVELGRRFLGEAPKAIGLAQPGHSAPVPPLPAARGGFADCPQHFAARPPPPVQVPRTVQLCFDSFAVLYSSASRTPLYAVERLNRRALSDARGIQRPDRTGSNGRRAEAFFADPRLPAQDSAELKDYRDTGFQRGHLAPAGDMPTARAMAQSFSLANVVPQTPRNNEKLWAKIERDTRAFARRADGDVYVITGVVFDGKKSPRIGGRVAIPTYLWKLVYDESSGRAWAHWLANRDDASVGVPISYGELVKRTGLELLPRVTVRD